jgi:SAM-dependent methyltransferase
MAGNSDQIAEWNGALGERWAELQQDLDQMTRPFGDAALEAAKIRPGEQAIDVGCGCGDTSFAIARAVGAKGSVLGLDISRPMLEVAERRKKAERLGNVSFREADASLAVLPKGQDLIFSRFGVMFFHAPVLAFAHLRGALKKGGRIAFCCWRHPRDNPWAMTPLMAARAALKVTPPPSDPHAPGPFAFADADRLRGILADAGFRSVSAMPFDSPVWIGPNPSEAARMALRFGPVGRFIREHGEHHLPMVQEGIETALKPLAAADGTVRLPGAVWVAVASAA